MKFLHLSDLHLGKRFYETSLIEDQADILNKIICVIEEEKPDGVLIAGDVYDKSAPSAEAVQLFDRFLVELAKRSLQVFVISGNHDSPERIAFGSNIMNKSGVYLSPVYDGKITPITLEDKYGKIDVYLLPFVKPSHVRRFFPDEEINSYTDAVRVAIKNMNVDLSRRNVIVTHQFVTGAIRSESEETVGGTDNVDASVFDGFDYVALGHLHSRQFCHSDKIKYSGTPLKYSFSEDKDRKCVTVVELFDKGENPIIKDVELLPLRDVKKIKGTFADLTDRSLIDSESAEKDYFQITLTDEDDIPDAMAKLQRVYKNAMDLKYDNKRTRSESFLSSVNGVEEKSVLELFEEFFKMQNDSEMSEEQRKFVKDIIEKIEED